MPEWATRRVAQTEDAKTASCSPKGNVALPQGETPRVASMGGGSNYTEVITKSKGEIPPRERWKIDRDIESIKQQIERHKSDTGFWIDQHGLKRPNDKPTPEAQEKIKQCRAELKRLEAELDSQVACRGAERGGSHE